MMKRNFVLVFLLCILAFCLTGCFEQLGETSAEGKGRHIRNARINRQSLMDDLDTVLQIKEPSKLSGMRIP